MPSSAKAGVAARSRKLANASAAGPITGRKLGCPIPLPPPDHGPWTMDLRFKSGLGIRYSLPRGRPHGESTGVAPYSERRQPVVGTDKACDWRRGLVLGTVEPACLAMGRSHRGA